MFAIKSRTAERCEKLCKLVSLDYICVYPDDLEGS